VDFSTIISGRDKAIRRILSPIGECGSGSIGW